MRMIFKNTQVTVVINITLIYVRHVNKLFCLSKGVQANLGESQNRKRNSTKKGGERTTGEG